MDLRRTLAAAAVTVVAAGTMATAIVAGRATAPPRFAAVTVFAAGRAGYVYLDVSDAPTRGVLLALVRYLDAQLGYPKSSLQTDGAPADPAFNTLHATRPIPHPTQAGRWMLPLDAAAAAKLVALRSMCRARVDAGTATGPCLVIAGIGNAASTVDDTWADADSGVRPWDAGPDLEPDDDYPGVTP